MSIDVNAVNVESSVRFLAATVEGTQLLDAEKTVHFLDGSSGAVDATLGAGINDGQWIQLVCVDATNSVAVSLDTSNNVLCVDAAGNDLSLLSFGVKGQSLQLVWHAASSRWFTTFGGYSGTVE